MLASSLAGILVGSMFFGWLMLAPFFVYQQGWRELPNLSYTGWSAVLFLGICCSALGYRSSSFATPIRTRICDRFTTVR